jgi:hypothetical protein
MDSGKCGGISSDGYVIVGDGTNPSGHNEAWIAIIPGPGDANGDGKVDSVDLAIW